MIGATCRARRAAIVAMCVIAQPAWAGPSPTPTGLTSTDLDRAAIEQLLATYTRAVSTRDQPLFETILLDREIPFSYVGVSPPAGTTAASNRAYEAFRKGVFEGAPFSQTFDHVRIEQDGALAQASMLFRNRATDRISWGFKVMQLIRVDGAWKIASEFFTVHDGVGPPLGEPAGDRARRR